jgi:hypothetical protein
MERHCRRAGFGCRGHHGGGKALEYPGPKQWVLLGRTLSLHAIDSPKPWAKSYFRKALKGAAPAGGRILLPSLCVDGDRSGHSPKKTPYCEKSIFSLQKLWRESGKGRDPFLKGVFERLTGSQLELSKEFQQIGLRETAETRMGAKLDCALKKEG